jgi:hypothetical protein
MRVKALEQSDVVGAHRRLLASHRLGSNRGDSRFLLVNSTRRIMAPSNPNEKSDKSQMDPGDEAPPGTPGTGENICPTCKGSGEINQKPCPDCGGTGKVVEGISGG